MLLAYFPRGRFAIEALMLLAYFPHRNFSDYKHVSV